MQRAILILVFLLATQKAWAACFSFETAQDCAAREYRERQERIHPRQSEQERAIEDYQRRQRRLQREQRR
jgi:hypothetical protein